MAQFTWDPRTLLLLSFGFIAGIFARSIATVGSATALFLFILALIALGAAQEPSRRVVAGTIAAVLVAFALGVWRMDGVVLRHDPYLDAHIGKTVVLEGVVSAEPDVREENVRLSVRADTASSTAITATVLAIVPPHSSVSYGERVRVRGTLAAPEAFDTTLGRQFNYPGYLAVSDIGYLLKHASVETLSPAPYSLTGVALAAKQWYVRGLENALPEPAAGLAAGITAGDKRGLGKEISEEFRITSLIHIVVLSGYNITIVASTLMNTFGFLPLVPRLASGACVAIFFSVVTGGASASVRAAIMAMIGMTARVSGRIYAADRALAVAAAAMAAWNPYVVAFDPGFQLSVLATAGLIWISPRIAPHLAKVPETFGLREIAIATVSAQIAVMPLLLYQNGTLSLVALPANLLVLAAVPAAMALSFAAGIAGAVVSTVAPIIGVPAFVVLSYVLGVTHLFASLSFAALPIPAFSVWWLAPVYLLMGRWVLHAPAKEAAAPAGAAAEPRFVRGI